MTRWISLGALLAGASFAAAAQAQVTPPPAEDLPQAAATPSATSQASDDYADEEDGEAIVVTGQRPRGSVIGDIPPENTLDSRDVRATGATDINELLEALAPQIGSARGRGGERPVLLLNGQRISSFRELRDLPTEAIQRVEILPEEVALKYGYRADQRVVNIILRRRFRSTAVRAEARTATEGGYLGGLGDVTRLMIGRDSRTTLNLRAEGNGALTESERDIGLDPDSDNPGLDDRDARTLTGSRRLLRGGATHNRTMFGDVSATFNGEVEHSHGRSLIGLPSIGELDPRVRDTSADSAHAGVALNGDKARWRWSLTGNTDWVRDINLSDPDDGDASRESSSSIRRSGELDATANGPLFKLPAGDASATFRVGARALDLDSRRRREGISSSSSLGRTQGNAAVNFDLPISRRNRGFDSLGNLTLNANGEVEQLSDFGTLTTIGAGLNWSPVERLNLIASWTREEGAPSVQQLGDPLLETPGMRIFDFTRGETVEVNALTGGNPDLDADRRNVLKLGGNWKPFTETDLRLRAEYVRSRLDRPVSSFPGPSAALEAAFPERFVRDGTGQLVSADLRPVNFDEARRDTVRWGLDFTKPLRSARPPQAMIDQMRARFRGAGGGGAPEGPPPDGRPMEGRGERGGFGGGGFGGGGFGGGRFGGGGGRQGGRLQFSLTHTLNLRDEVIIRPGVPELDYLHGDAFGSSGGRPRHEVEAQAGWSNNGLGARLSADWRSGTRVDSAEAGSLRFSPLATFDLRLFANLGERFELVAKHPWLRGTQVRFELRNLFDSKPKVRDAAGEVPFSYQPDLLDPLGRTVGISIRKLFSPPPSFFRRQGNREPRS